MIRSATSLSGMMREESVGCWLYCLRQWVDMKMESTTVTGTGFKRHSSLPARGYLSPEIESRQTFPFETFSSEDDLLFALKPVDGF